MEIHVKQLKIGCVAGHCIPLILHNNPDPFLRFRFVVFTCIDSNPNVAELKSVTGPLLEAGCELKAFGFALQVKMSRDALNVTINTFTGYDEIWFFDAEPHRVDQPPTITSERELTDTTDEFNVETLNKLPDWMDASGCTVGLGDGGGLNYVATKSWIDAGCLNENLDR